MEIMKLKPGLHIVVTIAEHACDHVLKSVLKPLTHRLQIFPVKYEYLPSLQLCEYQGIPGKLKNVFATVCLRSLQLIWRPGLTIKEDFHRGTCYLFSFSYHKITLFEKKYVIK